MDLPRIKPSTAALAAVAALVALAAFSLWLWQPERQVRKHNANLLAAAGDRNFRRVAAFLAPDYSDPWNESAETAVPRLREVLRQYFSLSIRETVLRVEMGEGNGVVTAHASLDGRGTAIAEMATRRVNALTEPFVFHWRKESWRPWDWKLVRVENPDLRVGSADEWW